MTRGENQARLEIRLGGSDMAATQSTLNVIEANIDKIVTTGLNPRRDFDVKSLEELSLSIREQGVLEPLIVRQKGKTYELVSGERRLKAAKMAGLKAVPVWVREVRDEEIREIMLLENLQRESLNPLEEAIALKDMIDHSANVTELASKLGKAEDWIDRRLRLLGAPEFVQKLLADKKIGINAVEAVLPFVGYKAADAIAREMEKDIQYHSELTGPRIKDLIDQVVCRDAAHALNFSDMHNSWGAEWHKKFDAKECRGCKQKVKYKERYGGSVSICLDTDCFGPKVRAARAAVKEARVKEEEKTAKKSGVIELSHRGGWKDVKEFSFDTRVCKGCAERVKGSYYGNIMEVCRNPDCFEPMQEAAEEELTKRYQSLWATCTEKAEAYLKARKPGLKEFELRAIMACMIDAVSGEACDYDLVDRLKKEYAGRKKAESAISLVAFMNDKALETELVRAGISGGLPQDDDYNDRADFEALAEFAKAFPEVFGEIKVETHPPYIEKPKAEAEDTEHMSDADISRLGNSVAPATKAKADPDDDEDSDDEEEE